MSRLEELRKANPHLTIYSVYDEAFKPFGCVVNYDTAKVCEIVNANSPMPEEGVRYVPWLDALDQSEEAVKMTQLLAGQLDEEWGLCWGYNDAMNGLEWHTCNEFNVGVTDLVLFLGLRGDIDAEGRLDANKVKAFYLPQGTMIEVFSHSLHLAPAMIDKNGFRCVVGLARGTNTKPNDDELKTPNMTAKNKWMIFHEDNPHFAGKDVKGIYGENWHLNQID